MDRQTAPMPVIIGTTPIGPILGRRGRLKEKGLGVALKPFVFDDLLHEVDHSWTRLETDAGQPGTSAAGA